MKLNSFFMCKYPSCTNETTLFYNSITIFIFDFLFWLVRFDYLCRRQGILDLSKSPMRLFSILILTFLCYACCTFTTSLQDVKYLGLSASTVWPSIIHFWSYLGSRLSRTLSKYQLMIALFLILWLWARIGLNLDQKYNNLGFVVQSWCVCEANFNIAASAPKTLGMTIRVLSSLMTLIILWYLSFVDITYMVIRLSEMMHFLWRSLWIRKKYY
jgi:hypothetical protein